MMKHNKHIDLDPQLTINTTLIWGEHHRIEALYVIDRVNADGGLRGTFKADCKGIPEAQRKNMGIILQEAAKPLVEAVIREKLEAAKAEQRGEVQDWLRRSKS